MAAIQGILQDVASLLKDDAKLLQDIEKFINQLGNGGDSSVGGSSDNGSSATDASNVGVSGSGSITGDPHFLGAEGQKYDVQGTAGDTYNLLSDTGIEVNGKFQQWGNSSANTVGELGIDLNGDKVDIKPGGQLTINGQSITQDGSYLNGAVVKNGNNITVKNDHYTLNVSDGGGYLNTNITATNAGRLQNVGGLWGQSLEGNTVDQNASDFQVSSIYANQNGGSSSGAGGIWDSIPTNFTPPTLPDNPTTQQTLQFEEKMFQYAASVAASTTEINTIGNAFKDAYSKVPQ